MVVFNRTQGFDGMCAPFMYIAGCTKAARDAYVTDSRFWLPVNSLALIALIAAFIYRTRRVREAFNTLRLAMVCFGVTVPLHIIFDALRVAGPDQHGVPPHIMAFLWVFGWVGAVSALCLLVVTWISFSSTNLLARPALTGNPYLFWGIEIPYIVSSIVLPLVCGISYWCYFVAMRVCVSSWAAMFLVLALFASYYGNQTLSRLSKAGDSFNYRQQARVLFVVVFTLGLCGICLGVQGFFLDRIDNFYQIFLLCTSLYRVCGVTLCAGSALYVWLATLHWVEVSRSTRTTGSQPDSARKRSDIAHTEGTSSSSSTSTSDEEEESTSEKV